MKTNKDFENFESYEMISHLVERWYNLDPDVRLWIMYHSNIIEKTAKDIEEMLRIFEDPTGIDMSEEGLSMPSEGSFKVDNELKRTLVIETLNESRRYREFLGLFEDEIEFGEDQVSES